MPSTKRSTSTKTNSKKGANNGAPLGFEEKLWAAADKMRGHMDAAEYKHVVLGLIFLKYISDAFEERHVHLLKEAANPKSDYFVREERARYSVAEDRDEYAAENVFWVPKQARWSYLQSNAKQPTIGKLIDEAMIAIEKENPSLKGVLSKDYARVRPIPDRIASAPGNWEALARDYLEDVRVGIESLNDTPQSDDERHEIFVIKRHWFEQLVERVEIDKDRNLRVIMRLAVLAIIAQTIPIEEAGIYSHTQ